MGTWRLMSEFMQITEVPFARAFWARFVDYPGKKYMFRVNNWNTSKNWEISKLTIKTPERHDLGSLLLTLNMFYTFFLCFYVQLWTSKCLVDISILFFRKGSVIEFYRCYYYYYGYCYHNWYYYCFFVTIIIFEKLWVS